MKVEKVNENEERNDILTGKTVYCEEIRMIEKSSHLK